MTRSVTVIWAGPLAFLIGAAPSALGVRADDANVARGQSVAAPLYERLRDVRPAWVVKNPTTYKSHLNPMFRKEVVEARDRLMRELSAWASKRSSDRKTEVVVLEFVSEIDANPGGRYRRIVLTQADDNAWAALERLDKPRPARLDSRSWELLKPYISGAASAGTVGTYHVGEYFDVALVAYLDRQGWHVSEFREYLPSSVLPQFNSALGTTKLYSLAHVLCQGLDIEGTCFAPWVDDGDVAKVVERLKTLHTHATKGAQEGAACRAGKRGDCVGPGMKNGHRKRQRKLARSSG